MVAVKVSITRWVEDYQPGIIECQLTDTHGETWSFIEKMPIVTADDLDLMSPYPQPGVIACEIVETSLDPDGREIVTIDTELPWHIESTTEQTRFTVYWDQLTDI